MHPAKGGENEWVKTKCICVSTIFISGINCKHICLHDPAINLKKKLKSKIEILHTGPIMTTSRHFLSIIYFCSFTSCYGVVRCTYWMTFPICNLIHRLSILNSYFFEQQLGIGKGGGCECVGGWVCTDRFLNLKQDWNSNLRALDN